MPGPSMSKRASSRYFNEQTEKKAKTDYGMVGKAIEAKKKYKKNKMGYTDYMSEGGSLSYKDWLAQ